MIRVDELRGLIAKEGFSQREVAKLLGVTDATFYRKMKRGVFDSDEICKLIELLNITNPANIFFCKTSHLTSDKGATNVRKKQLL